MKPILLIDGDQFLFKACAAVEKEVRWDDQNHVLFANENECWDNFTGMLERIFKRFSSREHALCFSCKPGFRETLVDPTYKGGRDPRKPLCYADLRQRTDSEYNTVSMPALEADDVMGILATKPGRHQRIIVSADKDMKTIPTTVWDGEHLLNVTEQEADDWHLYQTLCGDTADGYPGCPGLGDVAATTWLAEPYVVSAYEHVLKSGPRKGTPEIRWKQEPLGDRSRWDGVVSLYAKAGLTAEDALKQARLARILRWQDWDTKGKQPILWTP